MSTERAKRTIAAATTPDDAPEPILSRNGAPVPILARLRAVIDSERAGDLQNDAVPGGIDHFIRELLDDLDRRRAPATSLVEVFDEAFQPYSSTPKTERSRWLEAVVAWFERSCGAQPEGAAASPGGVVPPDAVAPPRRPIDGVAPAARQSSPRRRASQDAVPRIAETRAAPLAPPEPRVTERATVTTRDTTPTPTRRRPPSELDRPISTVKGFDKRSVPKFQRLGVETVRDLLYFFPHRHLDRRAFTPISLLVPGMDATLHVTVWDIGERFLGAGRRVVEATVSDGSGTITLRWFNQPWIAKQLRPGDSVLVSGKVDAFRGKVSLTVADYELETGEDAIAAGRLTPVYPLTEGLAQRTVRRLTYPIVQRYVEVIDEHLPSDIRARADLLGLSEAIRHMHFPESPELLAAATRRLAFDELFLLQLGLQRAKAEWQEAGRADPIIVGPDDFARWQAQLPYTLTGAQRRAIETIFADVQRDRPMARLLQGDVGSGKTVVAAMALAAAVQSGGQAAILAPTEILANQHYLSLGRTLTDIRPTTRVELLTGATKGTTRKKILHELAVGDIDVLIGTHAVIQSGVSFARLRLGVVDEQHRFGVAQRAALRQKGVAGDKHPHMLVMTATPIPRTLALTLYGDLDLSVLDEMPPGRQPIRTRLVPEDKRERAYQFVEEQLREGRQAFVICPLVEESDKIDARAATAEFERLQHVFPGYRLGLVHGRMKPSDKEDTMRAFRDGSIDLLVSTAVVEVGIDVPNATVMMIEGAERFGLAQLHQFRGRVGRGAEKSFCLLFSNAGPGEARKRLAILETTNDGFALAEADLEMRGPGEFFGVRQSGLPELRVAQMSDVRLLEQAREEAAALRESDPDLLHPDHQALRVALERLWQEGAGGDRS